MKKMCLLLVIMILATATGCSEAYESKKLIKEMVKKTYACVEDGQIETALDYARLAMQEGHEDDEFEDLAECLESYMDAVEALEKNNLKTATENYDKIAQNDQKAIKDLTSALKKDLNDKMDQVNDIIKSLEDAVKNDKDDDFITDLQEDLEEFVLTEEQELKVEKAIEEYKNKLADSYFQMVQEIDGYVESLIKGVEAYDTVRVASVMATLFRMEPYMNEHQRKKTYTYWNEWKTVQKKTEPPVNISPDEAIEIARKKLGIPSHGSIVAVQNGEYYIIRAEVDYGDYVDECGCNVSTYDGAVFGEVG